MSGSTDLHQVLRDMKISCDNIEYGFAVVEEEETEKLVNVIGTFKEDEGLTVFAPMKSLEGLKVEGPLAKLTVQVHTSLELIGLTAVLASKLAERNISANVVAAFYHDHIFIQYDQKDEAVRVLENLSIR